MKWPQTRPISKLNWPNVQEKRITKTYRSMYHNTSSSSAISIVKRQPIHQTVSHSNFPIDKRHHHCRQLTHNKCWISHENVCPNNANKPVFIFTSFFRQKHVGPIVRCFAWPRQKCWIYPIVKKLSPWHWQYESTSTKLHIPFDKYCVTCEERRIINCEQILDRLTEKHQ